jgi:hypothetical protein
MLDKCGIMWVFCAISSFWFMLVKCGQCKGFLDNFRIFCARMSLWLMLAKYGQFVGFWTICGLSGQF